ncbi:primosomal protein DnaT [Erwiniaceae bacterium BAC15a-03b]|uniref:Replication restart protein DnaT n=1 Tax=Winslowiella arboricola TaxID=2978220 RepID=A0A9J6PHK7_9GAMM|nr:primosomal protein DnaT [Winslowiella arboricola]MCU5772326.1 primosomal protein DnaT [Winslowiella arboricola]MCU5776190.1 primosomal protein DnaT [Winslowiella arboricola]
MSVKILTSTIIGLDAFRQHPLAALASAEQGAVAVFDNNAPVMYAVTPDRLAQLLAIEAASSQARSDVALEESLFDDDLAHPEAIPVPGGKFALYQGWQPDADFVRLAAVWGVALSSAVTPAELASFVSYWQAEGRMFHHVQWQQKLARSIQLSRAASGGQQKRDLNHLPEPDQSIPDGFRG